MPARTRRLCLDVLEGRVVPATLGVTFSPLTHTLTVVGTNAANQLTVAGDAADPTRFLLSSTTDTFVGGGTTFPTPTGVHSITIRMLDGDDSVTLANGPAIRLTGGLSIDGGDGTNSVTATDLTVGRNLAVRNGINATGRDETTLFNLNVGGGLSVANGDGDSRTFVLRNSAGLSTVRGSLRLTGGAGREENLMYDLNVGGGVEIRDGLPDAGGLNGTTNFSNNLNRSARSVVRGSISLSRLAGDLTAGDGFFDLEVGGNVTLSYGAARGGVNFDGQVSRLPTLVRGSVTVTGTGRTIVQVGTASDFTGLVVGKNFTVTGGALAETINLNKLTVYGATNLNLGGGANLVAIDDSSFAGAFTLTGGAGVDTVRVDTEAGSDTATTFARAVKMSLGAGVDALTLGGPDDANQLVVFASTFVVRRGAEGESPTLFGKDVYPFGGGMQLLV